MRCRIERGELQKARALDRFPNCGVEGNMSGGNDGLIPDLWNMWEEDNPLLDGTGDEDPEEDKILTYRPSAS